MIRAILLGGVLGVGLGFLILIGMLVVALVWGR